jgi:sugar phosphate isomerase/epimerase
MYSRRDFARQVMAGVAAAVAAPHGLGTLSAQGQRASAPANSAPGNVVNGVQLGVITYSFRGIPRTAGVSYLETVADACAAVGGGVVEVMARLTTQPAEGTREDMRQWRLTTPMTYFAGVRDLFAARGMNILSYTHTFSHDMTDAELRKMMEATKAMGARIMSLTMAKIADAPRLAPLAKEYDLLIAFHNRPESGDEVATPESFDRVLSVSDRFRINLDVGHFTAGNHDAVAALIKYHDRISHVHLKDRKLGRNGGDNLPWGQGETPLKTVLTTIRDRKWPLPCIVEYEYRGTGTPVEETKKCMDYARGLLA